MYQYIVRQLATYTFRVVKFDEWLNPLFPRNGWYIVQRHRERWSCTCGHHGPQCRHIVIVRQALHLSRMGWLYDYDNDVWERPMNDPIRKFNQAKERAL